MGHIEQVVIGERKLLLHAQKAAFLPDTGTLICSDAHIGKAGHFRLNGIPVPSETNKGNFRRLSRLFDEFEPSRIVFLGDLMHSKVNSEWTEFLGFLDLFPAIRRVLVRGNHELYPDSFYRDAGFTTEMEWTENGIRFVHIPDEKVSDGMFTLSGHLHPAVRLKGPVRQNFILPCFWFGPVSGVLPAFGEFTGKMKIRPRTGDTVFVIAEDEVIRIA